MEGITNASVPLVKQWWNGAETKTHTLTFVSGSCGNAYPYAYSRGGVALLNVWYVPSAARGESDILATGAPKCAFGACPVIIWHLWNSYVAAYGEVTSEGVVKMCWKGGITASTNYYLHCIYPCVE